MPDEKSAVCCWPCTSNSRFQDNPVWQGLIYIYIEFRRHGLIHLSAVSSKSYACCVNLLFHRHATGNMFCNFLSCITTVANKCHLLNIISTSLNWHFNHGGKYFQPWLKYFHLRWKLFNCGWNICTCSGNIFNLGWNICTCGGNFSTVVEIFVPVVETF